jgi:hypothetical protein
MVLRGGLCTRQPSGSDLAVLPATRAKARSLAFEALRPTRTVGPDFDGFHAHCSAPPGGLTPLALL